MEKGKTPKKFGLPTANSTPSPRSIVDTGFSGGREAIFGAAVDVLGGGEPNEWYECVEITGFLAEYHQGAGPHFGGDAKPRLQ